MTFDWPEIGQRQIQKYFQQLLVKRNFCHAYLLAGNGDFGQKIVAESFIQSLMCQVKDQTKILPCHSCDSCRQIKKRIHPDIFYLQRKIDKKEIVIEQIIELQKRLNVKAFNSDYQVAFIESAESLNLEAANRLLKILEEPPAQVIIILSTNSTSSVLPTIGSRCQIIKFFPLSHDVVYNLLQAQNHQRQMIKELCLLVLGSWPRALWLTGKAGRLELEQKKFEQLYSLLLSCNQSEFQVLSEEIFFSSGDIDQAENINIFTRLKIIIRDLFLIKGGAEDMVITSACLEQGQKLNSVFSWRQLFQLWSGITRLEKQKTNNINLFWGLESFLNNI